jgi:hypothetical protein
MAKNTLLSLANKIEKLVANPEYKRDILEYSKLLVTNLIDKSPVDTGELVSNWTIGLSNKKVKSKKKRDYLGLDLTSDKSKTVSSYYIGRKGSNAAIAKAASLEIALDALSRRQNADDIIISNPAPQTVWVNYGTANITPRYFIEAAKNKTNIEFKAFLKRKRNGK